MHIGQLCRDSVAAHPLTPTTMRQILTLLITALALLASATQLPTRLPYRDARLPVDLRVHDLLSRMTLDEKLGQLQCLMGWDSYERHDDNTITTTALFRRQVQERHIGMYWAVMRADPWTRKTFTTGLNPALAAEAANQMQRYAIDSTRLGIPLLLAEEAPHGHMAIGATTFPTGLGMSATWSPQLMQRVGQVIGREVRLQGGHISYGPVLDLARDPRWSRVEETMGEDPCLTATLASAMVRGLGGGDLSQPHATIATLKHFVAYGAGEGGQNGARALVTPRELEQVYLPPFKQVLDAGALSVMTAYHAIDGIPCTADHHLLTDVLRQQWHCQRQLVVSDLFSIDVMHNTLHTAASPIDAAVAALKAGVDVDLGGNCYALLGQAIERGLVSEDDIDRAVSRVLKLKFELGLFEHPYVTPAEAHATVNNAEAIEVARQVAQASITLLKNDGTLPLDRNRHIAVIGPNAHNIYNLLGDYTAPQPDSKVASVLDAIRAKVGDKRCSYAHGCAVRDTTSTDIAAAVQAALAADVVVAVVGGSSARDFRTSYEQTGAASAAQSTISDMECGEGNDRATLALLGHQERLLRALHATGRPLVVVYVEGRPLDKTWANEHANALLTAYYPGEQGAVAIADVLYGDYNPAGRLPITTPRHVGQLPIYYNRPLPAAHDYVDLSAQPLYPFGYGLSYTTFDYGTPTVTTTSDGGCDVTFVLTNTGPREGDEVVQLYLRHTTAPVAQPERQLVAFDRVTLAAGQSRHVTLHVAPQALMIVGPDMQWMRSPHPIELLLGSSSQDIKHTVDVRR